MIEKIATDVSDMLNSSTPSRDFDSLVGMGAHMKRMEKLLRLDLDEVRKIGIWGPPGIGKTTIARIMFDQVSNRFQLSAIMINIRGSYPRIRLNEYSAQLQLQSHMLSKIMNHKDIIISHLGVAQERLKDKKVLLVLDDVDHLGQLDVLAKEIQWFGPGSRIIITTEDLRVLKAHGIDHIYEVNFPSSDEAFKIFCMHAFGQKHPGDGFYELARKVTKLAGELPLGLKVLGSALKGMSKQEWTRILPMLQTSLNGEIESIIKFSYDALCDEYKDLFLYIACFFNYVKLQKLEEVLPKKFSHVTQVGIHVLAEKSLISIDDVTRHIKMHTLLKQFGIETSRKQFVHNPLLKCQLLVDDRDICEVLGNDTTDNRRFIGINFNLSKTEEELNISDKALERMSNLQIVRINGRKDLAEPERLNSLLYHSQKIRLLDWSYFPYTCLPSTSNLESLVELCMRFSKLKKLWEGTKQLKNLRWMDLSDSKDLEELPDLSTATNLEKLYLRGCTSLVELPSCIENLTNLRRLNLSHCSNLVELPSLGNATKLEELDLSYCSSLEKLPAIENATNLQKLKLQNCSSLLDFPPSIGTATNLKELDMSRCSNLVELPSSIGNLQRLSRLTMCGCSKLEALPTNIHLKSLFSLDLTDCSQLKSFPEISTNIEYLRLKGTAIKEVPLSIMSWSRLSSFHMPYFESLKEFPHALDIITELHLVNEDIPEVPPWFKGMSRLRLLRLHNCNNLISLPQLSDSLSYIDAYNCPSLERLDCSFNNPEILLKFPKCFSLNQEARDLLMPTSTFSRYAMLPGTQVPAWFNHRATAEGLLTIKLNESPLPKSLRYRFKACIVLVKCKYDEETSDDEETSEDEGRTNVYIDIMEKQNDLNVRLPDSVIIDRLLTDHMYTFEVTAEVASTAELVFKFKTTSSKWKIRECGLYQI